MALAILRLMIKCTDACCILVNNWRVENLNMSQKNIFTKSRVFLFVIPAKNKFGNVSLDFQLKNWKSKAFISKFNRYWIIAIGYFSLNVVIMTVISEDDSLWTFRGRKLAWNIRCENKYRLAIDNKTLHLAQSNAAPRCWCSQHTWSV